MQLEKMTRELQYITDVNCIALENLIRGANKDYLQTFARHFFQHITYHVLEMKQ